MTSRPPFHDRVFAHREAAGAQLAVALQDYAGAQNTLVLALPRGGVPVAAQVAVALGLPLDVLLVGKLGIPWSPEVALGAVVPGFSPYLDQSMIRATSLGEEEIEALVTEKLKLLQARELKYRKGRPALDCRGRQVILIDDGVATGCTLKAALQCLRSMHPARIVVAVPVAGMETLAELRQLADEVVCLQSVSRLVAVGRWYADFSQVDDHEVLQCLAPGRPLQVHSSLSLGVGKLNYRLNLPVAARALVVLPNGSGEPDLNPGNHRLEAWLERRGLATCRLDLLTEEEAEIDRRERVYRFSAGTLAERLNAVAEKLTASQPTSGLALGYCASGLTAGAALLAAAARPDLVNCLVCIAGRTDLAGSALTAIAAPTLLVVGELDRGVVRLNQRALSSFHCQHELCIIPDAGHHFEEPGCAKPLFEQTAAWFLRYLA